MQGDVAGVGRGQRVGHDLADRVVVRRVQVVGLGQRQHRVLGGLDRVRGVGRVASVLVAWPVSVNVPASRSAWVIACVPVHTTESPGASVATGIAGRHANPVQGGRVRHRHVVQRDVAGVRRGQRVGHDLTDRVVVRRVQVIGLGQRQHRVLGGFDRCPGRRARRFGAGGVAGVGERAGVEVGLGDRMRARAHHRRRPAPASRPGSSGIHEKPVSAGVSDTVTLFNVTLPVFVAVSV